MGHRDDDPLEVFFEAARRDSAPPDQGLLDRVLADAVREQPRPRGSFWSGILRELGGWPAMVGLGSALTAGLVLAVFDTGVSQSLNPFDATLSSFDLLDAVGPLDGFDLVIEEG